MTTATIPSVTINGQTFLPTREVAGGRKSYTHAIAARGSCMNRNPGQWIVIGWACTREAAERNAETAKAMAFFDAVAIVEAGKDVTLCL